jgi:hypothetical protein
MLGLHIDFYFIFYFTGNLFIENHNKDCSGNLKLGAFHPQNPNQLRTTLKDLRAGIPPTRGPVDPDDTSFFFDPRINDID